MGDCDGKVDADSEEDMVGPYGLGRWNDNGQCVVECCRQHNLFVRAVTYVMLLGPPYRGGITGYKD
jgi:hypothetical protein